ncbi:MAG: hypothetical protein FI717_10705 [SAR202 cluster bacterium]|nr:hypothetical protein [Chloroflexota bacterium]MQG34760.1 hypothetical protein [SAR202 cluster bacterium]HCP24577.1 hypothetical protein [Dehalococcoidia bacterium]|tara:strand:+ start:1974 stop:2471 length:498 start_codon:yes stop_codon:yes gene_type:complete
MDESGNNETSEQDRRLAVTLTGTALEMWDAHVETLKETDRLLGPAIKLNDMVVAAAMPLDRVFKFLAHPLYLLGQMLGGPIHLLFRLIITPFFGVVLISASLWSGYRLARPLLMVIAPVFVMLSLWMITLFPEQPGIKEAKTDLCKLWPLSRRRLDWIRERRGFY